jgi:hypothetical protein
VASWLARAREKLRSRLCRRGITGSAALLAGLLHVDPLAAAVAPGLMHTTLASAGALANGHTEAISATVLHLYQGVTRAMLRTRIKFVAVLLISVLVVGIGALNLHGFSSPESPADLPAARGPEEPAPQEKPQPPDKVLPGPGGGNKDPLPKKDQDGKGVDVKVESFTAIVLMGTGKVLVKQTGKESVTIKGEKNVMPFGMAKVQNGTLYLMGSGIQGVTPGIPFPGGGANPFPGGNFPFDGGVNPFPGGNPLPGPGGFPALLSNLTEFHIEVKDLKGLAITGSGIMDVRDVNSKQLGVVVGGTGDISISGKTDGLQLNITGTGNFKGESLKATQATVTHHGFGKAVVYVDKQLNVTVTGIGTVEYLGAPQVQKTILGIGKVVPKQ